MAQEDPPAFAVSSKGSGLSYSAESVRVAVEADRTRLFASYAVGRPAQWTCDQWTKDFVCLSIWLREELPRVLGPDDEAGRKAQENEFYRVSRRPGEDLFELAAVIMNDAQAGNIDRDRTPHKRWG